MPKRRRRDQTINGRTDGDSLPSGKTVELSCLLEETEFHRDFYNLSCPQNVPYPPIDGLFPNPLKQLLIDRKTQNPVIRRTDGPQVNAIRSGEMSYPGRGINEKHCRLCTPA